MIKKRPTKRKQYRAEKREAPAPATICVHNHFMATVSAAIQNNPLVGVFIVKDNTFFDIHGLLYSVIFNKMLTKSSKQQSV